ncbi:MAG: hypothetical protein V4617_03950 [Gemmatimonadota bacterium]
MSRWWAGVRFEVHQQRRDPLTTLYALVFFLLAFGYTSSGVVELVGDRGQVPRDAPWALTLAYSGLAAFGQVITTMIAATAVLRDTATRVLPLVATTGLTPRVWLLSRAVAAMVVTAAVYLAIPLGAMAGTFAGSLFGGPAAVARPLGYLVPFVVVTLPVMLCVAAILVAVGATTRRVLAVLLAALGLVMLWQLSLGLVTRPGLAHLGAWLDPFANAPVLLQSGGWTEAERAGRAVRFDVTMAVNRLVWLTLAAGALAMALWRVRWPLPDAAPVLSAGRDSRHDALVRGSRAARGHATASPFAALRRITTAWIAYDGGWRIVSVLAFLNATANALTRATSASSPVPSLAVICGLVSEHSRLFVILLATVYAGELLWRERELRVAALVDSSPVSTRAIAAGRMSGLALAQLRVVAALVLAALLVYGVRGDPSVGRLGNDAATLLAWTVFVVWLPFAQLTVLSLAVHALLRHKVLAHLTIIAGWVLAVTLDRQGAIAWWYRFAEPASLLAADGGVAWGALAQRAGYWSAVSGALVLYILRSWPRGAATSRR